MIHYITTQGLGQPWVGNELHTLQRAQVPFVLHAMRRPEHRLFESQWAEELNLSTHIIYPLPLAKFAASVLLAPFLFGRHLFSALRNSLFSERESMRARAATFVHLIVACHWARQIRRQGVRHIHCQWAHSSASVGMYGAWLLGLPFSFTGHAADLFRDRAALRDKIRRADFIICISTFHREFYLTEGAKDDQLHLAYCGIDPHAFSPTQRQRRQDEPYRILAAGRLVKKKGFRYLIEACTLLLDRRAHFQCTIAGSGDQEENLRAEIDRCGLSNHVSVTGQPLKQEQIPKFMHSGDLFCLPSVWSEDNDVEGLPQMLMEAMACGLPVLSTRLAGIPDLVIDGETGILVDPRNAQQLADAIDILRKDPQTSTRLATAGRRKIVDQFNLETSLRPLIAQFLSKLKSSPTNRQDTKQFSLTKQRPMA